MTTASLDTTPEATLKGALLALLHFALSRGPLSTHSAWRLSPDAARQLEHQTHIRPAGGWASLCGLAAGSFLKATNDAFVPACSPETIESLDESEIRCRLLEAFTKKLIPPSAASGLFILLGIHPAWGLRVAHAVNDQATPEDASSGRNDSVVFPPEVLEFVLGNVGEALTDILDSFAGLQCDVCHPLDTIVNELGEMLGHRGDQMRATYSDVDTFTGVPLQLSERSYSAARNNFRLRDFVLNDLFRSVLIPAHCIRTFDDQTITVLDGAFEPLPDILG
jgi:hypothetical protein